MKKPEISYEEVQERLEALRQTDFPPTQLETIQRALNASDDEGMKSLLALIKKIVVCEDRLATALLRWHVQSCSVSEHISSVLQAAATQIEDEILSELLCSERG